MTMKKKTFVMATTTIILFLFFVSCSNDPTTDAVPPVFEKIVLDPTKPEKGDTVTATIKFLSSGSKWYQVDYNWVLSRSGQESQYFITKSERQIGLQEPKFQFIVPDTLGYYTMTVRMGIVQASSLFPGGTISASSTIQNGSVSFEVTP